MKKLLLLCFASIFFTMTHSITHSEPGPTHDSPQLRTEDILMLFFNDNIYEVVGDY